MLNKLKPTRILALVIVVFFCVVAQISCSKISPNHPTEVNANKGYQEANSLKLYADANSPLSSRDGYIPKVHYSAVSVIKDAPGNVVVAVGNNGSIVYSKNGGDWLISNINSKINLNGIAYGKARYVSVGEHGTILISSDLRSWSIVNAAGYQDNILDIAYGDVGNGVFIAATSSNKLLYSVDGTIWTTVVFDPNCKFTHVRFVKDKFFAFDNSGGVWYSIDGHSWVQYLIDPSISGAGLSHLNIISLAYGQGCYLAITDNNEVLTSRDGKNTSYSKLKSSSAWVDIRYLNKQFVIQGGQGGLLASDDGQQWHQLFAAGTPLNDFAFDESRNEYIFATNSGIMVKKAALAVAPINKN